MNNASSGKRSSLAWLLTGVLFASASSVASAKVIYVDAGAPGGDG